jgi:hypothetical protein
VDWKRQGKTEVLWHTPTSMPPCLPQISQRRVKDRTRALVMTGRRLTVWAMAQILKTKKVKVLFYSMFPDFRKSVAFWKVPRLHSFVLLVRATCKWRWVSIIGGMIQTGETRSIRRKTCPITTLCTTNLIPPSLGSKPGLCGERKANNRVKYGKKIKITLNYTQRFSSYHTENTQSCHDKGQSVLLYREMKAVCSNSHIEHINTLREQDADSVSVKLRGAQTSSENIFGLNNMGLLWKPT